MALTPSPIIYDKDPILEIFKPYLGVDKNLYNNVDSPYFHNGNGQLYKRNYLRFQDTQYLSYKPDGDNPLIGVADYYSPAKSTVGLIYNTSIPPILVGTTDQPLASIVSNGVTVRETGEYPDRNLTTGGLPAGMYYRIAPTTTSAESTNCMKLEAPTGYLITGICCQGVDYNIINGEKAWLSSIRAIWVTPIANLIAGNRTGERRIGYNQNGTKKSEQYVSLNLDANVQDHKLNTGFALIGFRTVDKHGVAYLDMLGANVQQVVSGKYVGAEWQWYRLQATGWSLWSNSMRGWAYFTSTRPDISERQMDFLVGFQFYFFGPIIRVFEAMKYVTLKHYAAWLKDRSLNRKLTTICCQPNRIISLGSADSWSAVCSPYATDSQNSDASQRVNYNTCDIDMTSLCNLPEYQTKDICSCITPLSILRPGLKFKDEYGDEDRNPNYCWWKTCQEHGYQNKQNRIDLGSCPPVQICKMNSEVNYSNISTGTIKDIYTGQSCTINSNTPPPTSSDPPAGGTTPPPSGTTNPPPSSGGTKPPPPKPAANDEDEDLLGIPWWGWLLIVIIALFIIISIAYLASGKKKRNDEDSDSDEEQEERPYRDRR